MFACKLGCLIPSAIFLACGGEAAPLPAELPDAAASVSVDAAPMGRVETHEYTFAEGFFAEAVLELESGDSVSIELTTTGGPAFYNIHAHIDDETLTLVEDESAAWAYEFVPENPGTYWLLLGNRNQDTIAVGVELELFGEAVLKDWGE